MDSDRYIRQIKLNEVGNSGQALLSSAKVLVIGAGGLGCPVLQYLVAGGVGSIGIVDFDKIELSNLHRQVLFSESDINKYKAIAAKDKLSTLNSEIQIKAFAVKLDAKNGLQIATNYDILVDCTDDFTSRYLINDLALLKNIPLVYGALHKFEGQVSVFNYKKGPNYRCLFPNPPQKANIPNCSEIGTLGVIPGIMGALQANEVFKIILNIGQVLSGNILYFNVLKNKTNITRLKKSNYKISLQEFKKRNIEPSPPLSQKTISQILKMQNALLIDVREENELPKINNLKITVLQLPLSNLKSKVLEIDETKDIFFFCQTGKRASQAAILFKSLTGKDAFVINKNIL